MLPQRPYFIQKFREYIDYYPAKLPLPKINPDLFSFLSVIFSLFFLIIWRSSFPQKIPIALTCLIIALMLDWLDGLIARKQKIASKRGWLVDAICDRLSEGLIFLPFFFPWFYLFLWNALFLIISYLTKKQILLPLRQFFLIYLIIKLFFR